jgi:precorrin-6B methylase 2
VSNLAVVRFASGADFDTFATLNAAYRTDANATNFRLRTLAQQRRADMGLERAGPNCTGVLRGPRPAVAPLSVASPSIASLFALLILAFGFAQAALAREEAGNPPFVTTPQQVIERMLALAKVSANDTLIDLGSGDGRIVVHAAKRYGARALGVEMSAALVASSRAAAAREGVANLVRFEVGDVLNADLAPASVLTLYLSPGLNERLLPRILATMRPGSRVVSHDFPLSTWMPDAVERLDVPEKNYGRGGESVVMLWIVPADAAGVWRASVTGDGSVRRFEFSLAQQFQRIEGAIPTDRNPATVQASLVGPRIVLAFPRSAATGPGATVRASIEGDTMKGVWVLQTTEQAVPFEARRIRARPDLY